MNGVLRRLRVIGSIRCCKFAEVGAGELAGDAGELGGPLLHLAALTLAFGALGRLALRRFA